MLRNNFDCSPNDGIKQGAERKKLTSCWERKMKDCINLNLYLSQDR